MIILVFGGKQMKKVLLFLIAFAFHAHADRLILVGGGDYPAKAMQKMVEWSGGKTARILVITWATDDPDGAFKRLKEGLEPYSPAHIVAAPERKNFEENKELFLKELNQATGVFFTGGDQKNIMQVAKSSDDVLSAIQNKYLNGTVFGGSSAGTAVMPRIMYTGDGDFTVIDPSKVEMTEGLNLIPGILLDQHFIKRQRQNRLMSVLLRNEEKIGIGIDEDNAISIEDGKKVKVLGDGQVLVYERTARQSFNTTLLSSGQSYTLYNQQK